MSLVQKIKELCETKKTTLIGLERDLGLGRGTIRKWDNYSPSVDKIQKVADYFNVSTDYLLDQSNPNEKIRAAITSDPELVNFWEELSQREDLQLMFKQTRDLSPESVKKVIRIIKAIEDEEADE